MKVRFQIVIACGLVLGFVSSGLANGFRNPPEGASAMGRTGGKIAHADDPSAVGLNPANLVDIQEMRSYSSYTLVHPDIDFEGGGRSDSTVDNAKHIPSFFLAVPLKTERPMAFGFGMSSPWGQSTVWPRRGAFLGAAPHFAELMTLNLQPTLAVRLNDKVSVAAGANVMYSELKLRQLLPIVPGATTEVNLSGDGYGVGFNAALTYDCAENHRLAITYRSPIEVDYDGDTGVTGVAGPLVSGSDFDTEIEFPSMVVVGYGLAVTEKLRVGVDVEWIEFSTFDTLPIDVGVNNALGIFPPAIPQAWDDVWTFGLGADYALNEDLVLRAGWVYLESPIPDATMAPTLPDDNRHVVSVGAGYALESGHVLDVAYAVSMYERNLDSPNPAYSGKYDATVQLFQVSLNWLF